MRPKRTGIALVARVERAYKFARELEGDLLKRAPELAQLAPVAAYLGGDVTPPTVNAIRRLVADEEPPERMLLLALHMTASAVVGLAVLSNELKREPLEWHEVWLHEIERSLANANAVREVADALFCEDGWVTQKVLDPAFRQEIMQAEEPVAAKDMN